MFCDIEIMEIGDEVIIKNLWETLKYRVSNIKIINPSDSQEVLIQSGKDMVTLITCHPYTKNYKRYVVYCEREKDDEENNNQTVSNETVTANKEDKPKKLSESQYRILFDRYSPLVGVVIMGLLLIVLIVTGKKKK